MAAVDRSQIASKAALRQYAHAHDHWSEEEQLLTAQGEPILAEGAHQHALMCLRAYRAELDDPQPAPAE